jgi:hypothetical protein
MKRIKVMKIVMILTLTTIVIGFAVGCNDNNVSNNSNITTTKNEITDKKVTMDSETVDSDVVDNNVSNNLTEEENSSDIVESEKFTIYSKDVNTDAEVVLGTVSIDSTKTLEEKLNILAKELSNDAFDNLPIELSEITEVDGKKVAVFNLEEQGNNATETDYSKYEGISWFNNHFQGSAGGNITTYTLNKTLLQGDYTGEWIDGVKYLYKGEAIVFEHVESLGNITYR